MGRSSAMRRAQALTAAAALAALAGCAASPGAGHATTGVRPPGGGTVTGRLVMEGGPLGPGGQQPRTRGIPGLVEFTAGRRVVKVAVGRSGRFSVTLPPGTYHVTGRSPRITEVSSGNPGGPGRVLPCSRPLAVTVSVGTSVAVTLACIVP